MLTALTQAPLGIAIFDRDMRYLAASSQYLTDQGLPGDMPLVGRAALRRLPRDPAAVARHPRPGAARTAWS